MAFGIERVVRLLQRAIGVVWYLSWLVLVIAFVVAPVADWAGWAQIPNPLYDVTLAVTAAGAAQATAPAWGLAAVPVEALQADVSLQGGPLWFQLTSMAGWAVSAAIFMFFLYQLRLLLGRVHAGAPFEAQNARRLQWLGLALLLTELVDAAVTYGQSRAAVAVLQSDTLRFGRWIEFDLEVVFVAFVLLVLAAVFRRGAALEEDQALTI